MNRVRRAVGSGLILYASNLAFLGFILIPVWAAPNPWAQRIGVSLVSLLIAVAFVGLAFIPHWPVPRKWLWLGALTASIVLLIPFEGHRAAYYVTYPAVALANLIPWRSARIGIGAIALVALAINVWYADPVGAALAALAAALGYSIGFWIRQDELTAQLTAERERNAVLAVTAERERIGRDLHDILGHSLTAVAVKAQLARRLAERDPQAAIEQMAEVERLTRQALSEVRATASDIRQVRLAGETAGACSVLTAAGIECQIIGAATPPDEASSELLGYVVREAVTNVVRHSDAQCCEIELSEQGVRIRDDGRGMNSPPGNGLRGLTERVEQFGGRLTVTGDATGTIVEATTGERA